MAQIQEVRLVDDLDGGEATENVKFSIDGKDYEIDLSADNATALREVFTPYVVAARKVTKLNRDVTRTLAKAQAHRATTGPRDLAADKARAQRRNADIREWALTNGHNIAERGRIPRQVVEAYREAHGIAAVA